MLFKIKQATIPIAPTKENINFLMPYAKAIAEKIKYINADVLAKFMADESAMVCEVKDTIEANFVSSDTNSNGVLQEHQYLDFAKKMLVNWKASYSDEIEFNEDAAQANYSVLN